MENKTPAQLFALVVGATLVAAGILGFFYSAAFGSPGETDEVLGLLAVNGWHNLVHIATGGLLLSGIGTPAAARRIVLVFGVAYALVVVLGLIVGDGGNILGIIPINTEDNILHVLLALGAFGAYAASGDRGTATTARPAA